MCSPCSTAARRLKPGSGRSDWKTSPAGSRICRALARRRVPLGLLATLLDQLAEVLPRLSDPDRALNNLERFVAAARSPLALAALFEREPTALPILGKIFSSSQYLSDLLIRDGESYDLLRLTEGQPIARQTLVAECCDELEKAGSTTSALKLLRRFKQRQMLRVAYGDLVGGQQIRVISAQISYVADAVVAAALAFAQRQLESRFGVPRHEDGTPASLVVLALGKLGGTELNYSSDIDLVLLYSGEGASDGPRSLSNGEYFERWARDLVKLLAESTTLGIAYRVDLRLRPEGSRGPLVCSVHRAAHYYDVRGRTWERQAWIKARPIAGDLPLGRRFLDQLAAWIYRRYLTHFEIQGIQALRRQMERRAAGEADNGRNIKTGPGGIRDIEFAIQFLQLLNGSDGRELREANTLEAIDQLTAAGCLTAKEGALLGDHYEWLRKLEHRLQIMFDLQTHWLPGGDGELQRLAARMDPAPGPPASALRRFRHRLAEVTQVNRRILNHLLHHAFPADDPQASAEEVDLVLDPHPPAERIARLLAGYGFAQPKTAYEHLIALSDERIPFLSPRRCRHFLAAIAQPLLAEIARTPNPDETLVALDRVSAGLGGKAVLWELFSYNRPSLQLYVKLCATCDYLTSILTSRPGMIDALLDSLTLKSLPSRERMAETLADRVAEAADAALILNGFKQHHHLQIGVRDLLGRDRVRETLAALADVAELCIRTICQREWASLVSRYGEPQTETGKSCPFVALALGKLGGREPNYHSDLDVIFLYPTSGTTAGGHGRTAISHQHFFSELGSKVIQTTSATTPFGKLYEIDVRLRPTGRSGSLTLSFDTFRQYFAAGEGQVWERLALCKARPIFGGEPAESEARQLVHEAIQARPWQAADAATLREMRRRMQEGATPYNLKRGEGGTVDIEFIAQMLQLKYARQHPAILRPGTLDALVALEQLGCLSPTDREFLTHSYEFLRSVEARLRLMNTTARHDFPAEPAAQVKLALLMNRDSAASLESEVQRYRQQNRVVFQQIFDRHAREP